jgi:hypothetical protein
MDGKQFGSDVVEVVRSFMERSMAAVSGRLDALEKRLDTLPVPKDGKDADLEETAGLAAARLTPALDEIRKEIEALRTPPDFSALLPAINQSIDAGISKAVSAIPPAKDGEPGKSVTVEELTPVIDTLVEKRFSSLTIRDGIDGVGLAGAIIDRDNNLVITLTDGTAKNLGPVCGRDGTSVTVEQVAPMITAEVQKAVAALPPAPAGEPGKSVDRAEVEQMVGQVVAEAVATAIAALPEPAPSEPVKSVTVEEITPLVLAEVGRLIAEIPVPQDGKSVTVEEVAPMVAAEVAKAVSAIPVPKDGVGLADAFIDRDSNLILTLTNGTAKALGRVVGKDGEDAVSADPEAIDIPDDLNERIAKAVRLMAETPAVQIAAAATYREREYAPPVSTQPAVHVHMPEIKEMKVSMQAEIPPQQITVQNQLPPPRKTRTIVEEHDARGRVKKFRQEEIDG